MDEVRGRSASLAWDVCVVLSSLSSMRLWASSEALPRGSNGAARELELELEAELELEPDPAPLPAPAPAPAPLPAPAAPLFFSATCASIRALRDAATPALALAKSLEF